MGDERGGATTTGLLHEVVVEEDGGDLERESERPKEPWKGEYVKSIVYGGLDAIITCFSLISSISASSSSSGILVVPFYFNSNNNPLLKLSLVKVIFQINLPFLLISIIDP